MSYHPLLHVPELSSMFRGKMLAMLWAAIGGRRIYPLRYRRLRP
jgi:hypothetical protein